MFEPRTVGGGIHVTKKDQSPEVYYDGSFITYTGG